MFARKIRRKFCERLDEAWQGNDEGYFGCYGDLVLLKCRLQHISVRSYFGALPKSKNVPAYTEIIIAHRGMIKQKAINIRSFIDVVLVRACVLLHEPPNPRACIAFAKLTDLLIDRTKSANA